VPDADLLKHALDFGSFGLIAWLFFHTYTRLIPRLEDRLDAIIARFEETLERQHADCNESLARQQQKFDEILTKTRDAHERDWSRIADALPKINGLGN